MHVDDTMDLSGPDTEVLTAEDWKQALEEFEDENECENSSDDSDGSETNDVRCTVPRTASTAKATKIRPDEHWNCVVRTARFAKFKARQQRKQVVVALQPYAKTQGRKPRKCEEFPPLFIPHDPFQSGCLFIATIEEKVRQILVSIAECLQRFGVSSAQRILFVPSRCQCGLHGHYSSAHSQWKVVYPDSQVTVHTCCVAQGHSHSD